MNSFLVLRVSLLHGRSAFCEFLSGPGLSLPYTGLGRESMYINGRPGALGVCLVHFRMGNAFYSSGSVYAACV